MHYNYIIGKCSNCKRTLFIKITETHVVHKDKQWAGSQYTDLFFLQYQGA